MIGPVRRGMLGPEGGEDDRSSEERDARSGVERMIGQVRRKMGTFYPKYDIDFSGDFVTSAIGQFIKE